jgi:alpha-N-acetylglucosaminidase
MDVDGFAKSIKAWEWQWVNTEKAYPTQTTGSSVLIAQQLYDKYKPLIDAN